jgi:hypothetical protein
LIKRPSSRTCRYERRVEHKDGTFSRSEFEWREQDNGYRCPGSNPPAFSEAPTVEHEGSDIQLSVERGGDRIIEACVALQRTAIASMDGQIGYTPETLRRWVRQPSVPAVYVTGNDRRA